MKEEKVYKAKVVPNIKSSNPSERMAAIRISKAKGTKHNKTKVLEKVGLSSWEKFGEWLTTKGVEDYMEAMNQLGPRDKIVAFNAIIEYYKPKLTRSQVDVNANVVIDNISFELVLIYPYNNTTLNYLKDLEYDILNSLKHSAIITLVGLGSGCTIVDDSNTINVCRLAEFLLNIMNVMGRIYR